MTTSRTRKTTAPAVVDLDLDALEKEANAVGGQAAPFTFRIHGEVLSLVSGDDCDFRVLDALAKNDLSQAIELLLGPEQYAKFTKAPVSMKTLTKVLEGWSNHKGVALGE